MHHICCSDLSISYKLQAKSTAFRPSDSSQPDGKGSFQVMQSYLKLEILPLQNFLVSFDDSTGIGQIQHTSLARKLAIAKGHGSCQRNSFFVAWLHRLVPPRTAELTIMGALKAPLLPAFSALGPDQSPSRHPVLTRESQFVGPVPALAFVGQACPLPVPRSAYR